MTKQQQIDELLSRNVSEIIQKHSLIKKLKSGKKLRIKLGIDPTSPNLHIGRAVALWKLRAFQDLGHQVVFIVGDFTGLIGDTSDKDAERPMLTEAVVKANLKTYFAQAYKILNKSKTETHYNSKWLKKLGFGEIGKLADVFGLGDFTSRELIKKRMDAGKRVSVRELLYPLMQGYDSVAIKADVEIGGTDQRYNLLAGRRIQEAYKLPAQDVMTLELLDGTDGRKMSSSWGNVINLTDDPKEMFSKVMSIDDSLIKKYFQFATRIPLVEIETLLKKITHPRDQKLHLAESVTALYHTKVSAAAAKLAWLAQFSNKELPSDIPTKKIKTGSYQLSKLLVEHGLCTSNAEAKRLIVQRGMKVDQKTVEQDGLVELKSGQALLVQAGKRKFVKLLGQ